MPITYRYIYITAAVATGKNLTSAADEQFLSAAAHSAVGQKRLLAVWQKKKKLFKQYYTAQTIALVGL